MSDKLTVRYWTEDEDEEDAKSFEVDKKWYMFDPNDSKAKSRERHCVEALGDDIYQEIRDELRAPDDWDDMDGCYYDEPEAVGTDWATALKYGIDFKFTLYARLCAGASRDPDDEPRYFGSFDEDGNFDYDYDVHDTYYKTVTIEIYDGDKRLTRSEDFYSCPLKDKEGK